jgi:hypothetical protein
MARPARYLHMEAMQPPEEQGPRLLNHVREAIRARYYSLGSAKAYIGWIRRLILFHKKRHPAKMGEAEIVGPWGRANHHDLLCSVERYVESLR